MKKMLYIARREFLATALTKGFIFGVLVTPAMLGLLVFIMPRVLTRAPSKVEGRVAIIDPTGEVAADLDAYLRPERYAERRAKAAEEIERATPAVLRQRADTRDAMQRSMDVALGQVPRITLVRLEPMADLEAAKAPLRVATSSSRPDPSATLALIVVHRDAVRRAEGRTAFGTYDLFTRSKLDDRFVDDLHRGLAKAIVAARLEASGVARDRIEGLADVPRPAARTVTAAGEQEASRVFDVMLIPVAFMMLLIVSVLMSGQYLLTSTVEEKANRVVEVLLSAVSAMELMTGKILGQMAVGLVVLVLYLGVGLLALATFAALGLVDPVLIVYLLIFYVLAYFTSAAMMAAIGAAVNEMREAQSLMTPVMLVLMIPWVLWFPITRDPNSTLAVVLSFVPPVGNFAMLLRMTSTAPPPYWQVWVSILLSGIGVYASLWFAAKVFRVGLLMFGKPPTLGTLVRWARSA